MKPLLSLLVAVSVWSIISCSEFSNSPLYGIWYSYQITEKGSELDRWFIFEPLGSYIEQGNIRTHTGKKDTYVVRGEYRLESGVLYTTPTSLTDSYAGDVGVETTVEINFISENKLEFTHDSGKKYIAQKMDPQQNKRVDSTPGS